MTHYSVIPTFCAGSPAQVRESIAVQVAREEAECFERAKSGIYGDATALAATDRGLSGIAFVWKQKGRGAVVIDLITGDALTFREFGEFQFWIKKNRDATKRYHDVHYARTALAR